jgi:hypothetical protein
MRYPDDSGKLFLPTFQFIHSAHMFNPILDPDGVIDRRTSEDIEAIDRLLQMERDGLITFAE